MGKIMSMGSADQRGGLSDALVAFYMTEETGLPCNTKDYSISSFKAPDSTRTLLERRALRVTFEKNTSVEQQLQLLTFGSDDQRCNVILMASEASPVHCKVFAQLNSGSNIWVIEDSSSDGTVYLDDESLRNRIPKKTLHRRVAVQGLCRIKIGRYLFTFGLPSDDQETSRRRHWFQNLDPILVTQKLLQEQLCGAAEEYRPVCLLRRGGMGAVSKYIERTTGLMIAVKEEEVETKEADERVQKEIRYMQTLRHPNLVEYISSNPSTTGGINTWHTAMPLYQGCLCDILPLEITAIEAVMLQLFDCVNYMHGQRVLHKDIKPENILVKGKSRPDVVLADYGLCVSLDNPTDLMGSGGTPGYAAPEVSRRVAQTAAVDIFALGATLFFILEPERCIGHLATIATLGNVMRRPPKVYSGLVQSMMALEPRERPSLKECFEIVGARQHDWKKRTLLELPPSSLPSAFGPRWSQRHQKAMFKEPSMLKLDRLTARRPRLAPIAANRMPQKRPGQQQAPEAMLKEPSILKLDRFTARRPRLAPIAANRLPQKLPGKQQAPEAMFKESSILKLDRFTARRPRLAPIAANRLPQKRPGQQQAPEAMLKEPSILNLDRFTARRPRLAPIAANRLPQNRPGQQQAPPSDFKAWAQMEYSRPQIAPFGKPEAPARVDFSVTPPPTSAAPFANLEQGPASNMAPRTRRQATPTTHEPTRTPIRKPDNDVKRRIRRGHERRQMVERWHGIRTQKDKICHAAGDLATGTPLNLVRGFRDLTEGSLGITGQYLRLVFSDLAVAIPALQHIAPQSAQWGLNTNKRLMYGLKSGDVWPMALEEYEAERLRSEQRGPDDETEGGRGRDRVDRGAGYWRGEGERGRVAEGEVEERDGERFGVGRVPGGEPRGGW